jgi:hypothetical protein
MLQGVTFPAYLSLRKTAGAPGEKTENPNYNCSLSKANSTTKDLKTCTKEVLSNNKFQKNGKND